MSDADSTLHTRPSLLLRLRNAQDAEAWSTFVDTYAPLIHGFCRKRGLQDSDAADVAQEVLAQVSRSVRGFEYDRSRGRFRDWLGAVTRSKLARFHRAGERMVRGTGGEAGEEPMDQVAGTESDAEWTADFNAHVLRVALDRIKPHFEGKTWQAFERVWIQERTAAQSAQELGLSIDAVYVAKSRVLKRLREEVLALAEDLPQFVPLY